MLGAVAIFSPCGMLSVIERILSAELFNPFNRFAREYSMCDIGRDRFCTFFQDGSCGIAECSCGIHDVNPPKIQSRPSTSPIMFTYFGNTSFLTAFIDDSRSALKRLASARVRTTSANIRRYKHQVCAIKLLFDISNKHGFCIKIIHWNIKEPLNLSCVQVKRSIRGLHLPP